MIACSSFLQPSSAQDKENVILDDNTDWLHTNHDYVRTRQPTYDNSCVPNNLSSHTLLDTSEATPGAILLFFSFLNMYSYMYNSTHRVNVFQLLLTSWQLK